MRGGLGTSADIEHCRLRTCEGIELFLNLMLSSIVAPAPKHTIAEAVLRHKHSDGSACTGMANARELTTPPEPFRSELMNSEGMNETFGKGPIAPGRA